MGERHTEYILTDPENGAATKVVYVSRWCGCASLGCVDDELQIFEDGDDQPPFKIPISQYVAWVFDGFLSNYFDIQEVKPRRASED